MKVIAVTQARTGSTRLPGKILKKINGKSLLEIHVERIKNSVLISKIIIATTSNVEDDSVQTLADEINTECFRGSENDVLDRFYQAMKGYKPDYIVRLTSDCPLIDSTLIDQVVQKAIDSKLDYCSNTLKEEFPDGQDVEVFTFSALELAYKNAKLSSEREHVTPYIRLNSTYHGGNLFKSENFGTEINYSHVRLTVDEQKDLDVIEKIVSHLGLKSDWKSYVNCYLENEDIHSLNSNIARNEGYIKSLSKD